MYRKCPHHVLRMSTWICPSSNFARPKSVTQILPTASSSRFDGLMSRCSTPRLCAYARASATWVFEPWRSDLAVIAVLALTGQRRGRRSGPRIHGDFGPCRLPGPRPGRACARPGSSRGVVRHRQDRAQPGDRLGGRGVRSRSKATPPPRANCPVKRPWTTVCISGSLAASAPVPRRGPSESAAGPLAFGYDPASTGRGPSADPGSTAGGGRRQGSGPGW